VDGELGWNLLRPKTFTQLKTTKQSLYVSFYALLILHDCDWVVLNLPAKKISELCNDLLHMQCSFEVLTGSYS
jgi:hypothetical protein